MIEHALLEGPPMLDILEHALLEYCSSMLCSCATLLDTQTTHGSNWEMREIEKGNWR